MSLSCRPFTLRRRHQHRRGAIAVLAAFLLVAMVACVAFAVDIGYLLKARTDLQRTADASALAGVCQLIDRDALQGDASLNKAINRCRNIACTYSSQNPVCSAAPTLDANNGNQVGGDIVVGYLSDLANSNAAMSYGQQSEFNAVTVRVRRSSQRNGMVPLFFARIFGLEGVDVDASATAAVLRDVGGFRTPQDGSNLPILPIALDERMWETLLSGNADDDWAWDSNAEVVRSGKDGIRELCIYPEQNGASGNYGTLNIGTSNNSTTFISRQIRQGISSSDLGFHGGDLDLGSRGALTLSGNPGLSAGMKDDLTAIIGQPRVVPIFRSVTGNGGNAQYEIVKFVGMRIMEVELTGGEKRVVMQPSVIMTKGAIQSQTGSGSSSFIYAAARLVR